MKSLNKSFIGLITAFFVFIFIGPSSLNGQAFSKIYTTPSGDKGNAIVQTLDGGYATVGYTSGITGNGDILLLKLDANGDGEWGEVFGHTDTKQDGYDLKQCADGSFIMTGYSYSWNYQKDVYVVKTNSSGDLIWEQIYNVSNNQIGKSILELSNGDFVITGSTTVNGIDNSFVMKIDAAGNELWNTLFSGEANDIVEANNGDLMMVGTVIGSAGDENVILARVDASGTLVWENELIFPNNNSGHAITAMADGNFAITGYSEAGPADYLKDIYICIITGSGNVVEIKTYGVSNKPEIGNSIEATPDGGFVMAGRTGLCDSWGDMYLLKLDSKLDMEWEHCYGGPPNNQDEAYDVNLTSDGGYIVAGKANGYTDHSDVYVVRTDGTGHAPAVGVYDIVALDDIIGAKKQTIGNSLEEDKELNQENLSIAIFDCNGRLVHITDSNTNYQSDLYTEKYNNDLPLGIYIYRITDPNGQVIKQGKLLIE